MKILFKHRTRGKAVESVHIRGMISGFRALKHDVSLVAPFNENSKSKTPSFFSRVTQLISLHMPTLFFELSALAYSFIIFRKTQMKLNRDSYDLIYERFAGFDFSSLLVKKKRNIPIVLEVNGFASRKDPTHARKIFIKPLACFIEKRLFNICELIVVVSNNLKRSLLEIGIPSRKIIVIPNAINEKGFIPDINNTKLIKKYNLKRKKVIGFVGSFTSWHGVGFLLETFIQLCQHRDDIHLLLVGDGKERKKIESQVKQNNMDKNVTLPGRVSHKDIPFYISVMDITTMPDSNNFGSPMKIFEYMAMEKPVVSARYGPTEEIIKDGENGFLFNPRDKKQFSDLILKLLDNDNLRKAVGEKAKKYVHQNHTWEKNAEKVLKSIKVKIFPYSLGV